MNSSEHVERAPIGLLAFMATVTMLFTAFTASYLIRRTGMDWHPVVLPASLWANTALLGISSITLECARRAKNLRWLQATLVLGVLFLVVQIAIGAQLARSGITMQRGPHASFLYVLAGIHGIHLIGGMIALGTTLAGRLRVGPCAAYWHLMGALWLWSMILLSL